MYLKQIFTILSLLLFFSSSAQKFEKFGFEINPDYQLIFDKLEKSTYSYTNNKYNKNLSNPKVSYMITIEDLGGDLEKLGIYEKVIEELMSSVEADWKNNGYQTWTRKVMNYPAIVGTWQVKGAKGSAITAIKTMFIYGKYGIVMWTFSLSSYNFHTLNDKFVSAFKPLVSGSLNKTLHTDKLLQLKLDYNFDDGDLYKITDTKVIGTDVTVKINTNKTLYHIKFYSRKKSRYVNWTLIHNSGNQYKLKDCSSEFDVFEITDHSLDNGKIYMRRQIGYAEECEAPPPSIGYGIYGLK